MDVSMMLRPRLAQGLRVAPEILDEEVREGFGMGRWLVVGVWMTITHESTIILRQAF